MNGDTVDNTGTEPAKILKLWFLRPAICGCNQNRAINKGVLQNNCNPQLQTSSVVQFPVTLPATNSLKINSCEINLDQSTQIFKQKLFLRNMQIN